jgi:hypothetical protein
MSVPVAAFGAGYCRYPTVEFSGTVTDSSVSVMIIPRPSISCKNGLFIFAASTQATPHANPGFGLLVSKFDSGAPHRKIYGPTLDNDGTWRIKTNEEVEILI